MKKNVLVTGSNGQLGSEIKKLVREFPQYQFFFTDIAELDICNYQAVSQFMADHEIEVVINCAAYTAVDKAESEPESAYSINTFAPGLLAEAALKHNCLLVHLSTDYIFDGSNNTPYKETDSANPMTVYGKSKFAGEQAIIKSGVSALIIRTSWLYSAFGHNFLKTILRLAGEREQISVVADQIGSPTYAHDLARCILQLISLYKKQQSVIYHYSNEGSCSWYEFAIAIVELSGLKCKVIPISTTDYPLPAVRPPYSILDKTAIKTDFGIDIPPWKPSLEKCITELMTAKS